MPKKHSNLTHAADGTTNNFTHRQARATKKFSGRSAILNVLINNLGEDLENYLIVKDIAEKLELKRQNVSYHIKILKEDGFVKYNEKKSKLYRSLSVGNGNIYTPTQKGIEYLKNNGGLSTSDKKITDRVQEDISLFDLHSPLYYRYEVSHMPEIDRIDWSKEYELRHGVVKRVYKFGNHGTDEGNRGTLELTIGRDRVTAVLRPKVTSPGLAFSKKRPENLMKACDEMSWIVYSFLQGHGYELSFPKRSGEGKFTLVHEGLRDHVKTPHMYTDESRGEVELHPDMGSLEGNSELAKALTEVGYLAELGMKVENNNRELRDEIQELTESVGELRDAFKQLLTGMAGMDKGDSGDAGELSREEPEGAMYR